MDRQVGRWIYLILNSLDTELMAQSDHQFFASVTINT